MHRYLQSALWLKHGLHTDNSVLEVPHKVYSTVDFRNKVMGDYQNIVHSREFSQPSCMTIDT